MNVLNEYRSATLVKGVRWYVTYYQTNPETGQLVRSREYRQMNRIKDLSERYKYAMRLIDELNNNLLPFGYPYVEIRQIPQYITVEAAVKLALDIKGSSDRIKTKLTYKSIVDFFLKHLNETRRNDLLLMDWKKRDAMMFMDHVLITKKVQASTYNNYRSFMGSIWNELIERSYTNENPWTRIKKKRITEKKRKMLTARDAQVILDEAYKHDRMMFLSIMLLYYCFIRPGEQRRMTANMIDLESGIINLPGEITKNKKTEMITIPTAIIDYMYKIGVAKWKPNDYIFGEGFKPHPSMMCGSNTMNTRHKSLITKLNKARKLQNIDGISIYSWKDTGAMALLKNGIDAYDLMRQMRHSDLATTQKYLKGLSNVNESIRNLNKILLPTK